MAALHQSINDLRDLLLKVKATGADGFEGLVADVFSAMTGLLIRLAKSGSQFGRDASSSPGPFAVAMEAKRYDENLRLEVLAGKAVVGGHVLAGKVDLWMLGATSEVGDDTVQRLAEILGEYGVSLSVLDWSPRPLPPLAVFLTSARDATLTWFAAQRPDVAPALLRAILDAIAAAPSFPGQAEQLKRSLTASEVGLDALRQRTAGWLRVRFVDRLMSQRTFGQFITIANPSAPALPRSVAGRTLGEAMLVDPQELCLVAVLGSEGVGKTWLVAQWWAALSGPPIMIFVAGRRAEALDPSEPLESLAKLLAQQDGRSGQAAVAGWLRRLKRWRDQGAQDHLRFVVVLDGLNEHGRKPWADILKALAPEVHALGGLIVITARDAFWRRDVLPRIRGSLAVREIPVAGYADAELSAILARVGMAPANLAPRVREFVRNPRICAVALMLLDRLSLQPAELTVERLLFEYWQCRMEERGDLVGHNIQDFEKLLRSHARAWLDHPNRPFDRDEWMAHSGAIRRSDGRDVHNDLTDIEEGRFLRIAPDDSGAYEFRQETLPFALALLVTHELKSGLKCAGADAHELLDGILDAVRGFDIVAEIVGAAAGLACIDSAFPKAGRLALIQAWLGLQNVDDHAFATMSAYVLARPEAFLDAAELSEASARLTNPRSLLELLAETRDHPRVRLALRARLPQWLGRWSRQAQIVAQGDEQVKRQTARKARIAEALAKLSPEECRLLDQVCVEVPAPAAMHLDSAAALLMAGRPQAQLAAGLVGWALARAVAADFHGAGRELAWAIRLNTVDHTQTEAAVRRLIEPIISVASEPVRRAAAIVLDLLGTRSAAAEAGRLVARGHSEQWRRVETFCDTNPYDPDAPPGSNLDNARAVAIQNSAIRTWQHMGATAEDHNLEDVTPALARFDPPIIVSTLRDVVRSIEQRSQLPFRQLAWRLAELSPLFDEDTIRSVKAAYTRLISQSNIARDKDFGWIAAELIGALNPHLEAEAQFELLLHMPPAMPEYLKLWRTMKPLSPEALERRLEAALARPGTPDLKRTLFFASAAPAALTDRARQIIAEQVSSADTLVAACASSAAYTANDAALNTLVLEQAQRRNRPDDDTDQALSWRARSVAAAVIQQKREDLLHLVAPRFRGCVAVVLGGRALSTVADDVELMLSRLSQPVATPEPQDAMLMIRESEDGLYGTKWVEESNPSGQRDDLRRRFEDLSNPDAATRRFEERQRELVSNAKAFETALTDEGAAALASAPPRHGHVPLAEREPERVARWLDQILNTADSRTLRQVHNLGIVLACAYVTRDGDKAAAVLRLLRDHRPFVTVVIGPEHIPLYENALFGAAETAALDPLREAVFADALDDASLQAAVAAAETCGARVWLDGYMDRLLGSARPDQQARGLTIAGLRHANGGSDRVLAESWGRGFLGEAAAAASKNYRRDGWARYWFGFVRNASDPIDFWRYGKLSEGVADWRFATWFNSAEDGALMTRFGDELYARLERAAEKRTKKRKDTLFGFKAPDRELATMLRDALVP